MCLSWQHWTKALVWFDDTDISPFHSCVVDLWQSLFEWHLLLSCVFWRATARMSELELEQRKSWKGCVKRLDGNDPNFFANNSWILHHDNAPAHTALSVREILATKQITVLEHPAYSPDLSPSDFFLFPKINEVFKGRHFYDIVDIRSNTTAGLKAVPQNQFQNCFEGWTRRRYRCIASQGEYCEGDHGGIQQ